MDRIWLHFDNFLTTSSALDWAHTSKVILQVLFIGYAVLWIFGRIRGTQAQRLLNGLALVAIIWTVSWMLDLQIITNLFYELAHFAVLALVIIFQPEIRRGLGYLGRTTFTLDLSLTDSQKLRAHEVIEQIIYAVRELSKEKTGALIVIEPAEGERDYLSPGTTINADVSSALLQSIFTQKSPLHDGAVVIRGNKIVAAGVILPITDNPKLSYKYGTRHRAAIGLSEIYDGVCIVVSEETGSISAANRGMLVRYNCADDLSDPLSYLYHTTVVEAKTTSPFQSFMELFASKRKKAAATTYGASDSLPAATAFHPDMAMAATSTSDTHDADEDFSPDVADDDIRPQAKSGPV